MRSHQPREGPPLVVIEIEARHFDGGVVGGGHLGEALRVISMPWVSVRSMGTRAGNSRARRFAGGEVDRCDRRRGSRGRRR